MTEDDQRQDDLDSLWERLWGPREGGAHDDFALVGDVARGARRNPGPDSASGARSASSVAELAQPAHGRAAEPSGNNIMERVRGDLGDLRSHFEAALSEQIASVRSELSSTVTQLVASRSAQVDEHLAQSIARLMQMIEAQRAESKASAMAELTALRSDLDVNAARQLDRVRGELLAAGESRLDVFESDVSERLAGVEDRVGPELQRFAQTIDARLSEVPTKADLAALRSDMQGELKEQVAEVRGEAAEALGRAVEGGAAGRDALARLDVVEAADRTLDQRLDQVAKQVADAVASAAAQAASAEASIPEVPTGGGVEVDDLRSELEAVQRRIDVLDAAVSTADEQMVERLDALAGWVLTEAKEKATRVAANADALAPMRSDVQLLQDQVREMNASLDRLQPPAPRRHES